jgi:hypothetical protein
MRNEVSLRKCGPKLEFGTEGESELPFLARAAP